MPLPSYMLAQPTISPVQIVANRMKNIGASAEIDRTGTVVTVRNLDTEDGSATTAGRAIKLVVDYADAHRLSIDAVVPDIVGQTISAYLACGFQLFGSVIDKDDDEASHTILRRAPRAS